MNKITPYQFQAISYSGMAFFVGIVKK